MQEGNNRHLLLLCLILYLFGSWQVPITDPTEACYTLTAKEMLAAGDWFSPRIYGDYWYDKPIFFYWELLLAYSIFGVNEFASRLFPAIFATLGVLLTYFFASRMYNRAMGFTAAVILATSLEYWYIAHAVITDMTLFCAVSSTLMIFYFGYTEQKYSRYYICYALCGIAILTKGPIGFCLPALIIFLFLISMRDVKHLLQMHLLKGTALMLAIVAIWYLPMYIIHGSQFIYDFIGVHNFLRATVSEHPEVDVWYFYSLIFIIGFSPWILPILYSLANFRHKLKFPALDMRRKFLLIWAVTVFILFQSFATKYVTYTLPYMMPLAILFAEYFIERKILFQRVAICAIIIMIVGTFIAIPICKENSGHDEAMTILPLVDENTCVVSFSNLYSGSLVFYLGTPVYRLETAYNIAQLKPDRMKWTATNVMPFMDVKDLPRDKNIIAVVSAERSDEFFELIGGNWKLIDRIGENVIYQRVSLKKVNFVNP